MTTAPAEPESLPAASRPVRHAEVPSGGRFAFALVALLAWLVCPACGHAGGREVSIHKGMANASAVAVLTNGLFAVASDEDNRLRIYRNDQDGGEVGGVNLSDFLSVHGRLTEVDLEGAARIGDLVYWIGSHSRSKDGKFRQNRHRLFATRIVATAAGIELRPEGRPYAQLLDDLIREPKLAPFRLESASHQAPEDGGLNIEGLAAGPDGELWVGFRSPIPGGKALLIPVQNPAEVIQGKTARVGDARLLDLDGLGVRDMAWTGREWFIIAGRAGSGGNARLYHWAGGNQAPVRVEKPGFRKFNPEAIGVVGTSDSFRLLVLSDDGNADKGKGRQFRSFWVDP